MTAHARGPWLVVFALGVALAALSGCSADSKKTLLGGDEEIVSDIDDSIVEQETTDETADIKDEEPVATDGDAEESLDEAEAAEEAAEEMTEEAAEPEPEPEEEAQEAEPEIEIECPTSEPFDYTCNAIDPSTCPGGTCVLNMCIGPVIDPHRWDTCGDQTCEPCETASGCPADCAEPPAMTGTRVYDNDTTISVWAHGFYNKSPDEMAQMVYGEEGCGSLFQDMQAYGVNLPCGATPENATAPNQFVKVEYYGGVPASWLTQEDIAEIEQYPYSGSPDGLKRYAIILAKFIRYKLTVTGATHVNIACHSMGCLITRYMIENNLENLAVERRFVRWFTSAGVLAGARLARLYDNEQIRQVAEAIGLEVSDFIFMNPDYVMDYGAAWDHKLYWANSPYFGGILMHHDCATDPRLKDSMNITLLDLNNPGDEPNDGIMYTFDEFFHFQNTDNMLLTPSGVRIAPTHTYVYVDHMNLPDTDAAIITATAALFHKRKVFVTLKEVELLKDRENHDLFDGEHGTSPGELTISSAVWYAPYVNDTFGKDVMIHQDLMAYRTPWLWQQYQGQTLQPDISIFEGPVFDDMDQIKVDFALLEADYYKRWGVNEWAFDADQSLIEYKAQVPLQDAVIPVESEYAKVKIEVKVVTLY